MIALLTWMNTRGLQLGKLVQNVFHLGENRRADRADIVGLFVGLKSSAAARQAISAICGRFAGIFKTSAGFDRGDGVRPVRGICVAQTNSLVLRRRLE